MATKNFSVQPMMRFSGPWASNILNNDNKWQKNMKKTASSVKNAKILDKKLKTIPLPLETKQ